MASTPKRRKLFGRPLLLVTSAAAALAGCGGSKAHAHPVSNPIAPPQVTSRVCLDVTPLDATVTVTGIEPINVLRRCTEVTSFGSVEVTASAPGWSTYQNTFSHTDDGIEEVVKLQLEGPPPPPPPIGNLMPPAHVKTQICVDATPIGATVKADGANTVVFTERCADVLSYGLVVVTVSEPGFQTVTEQVDTTGQSLDLNIALRKLKPKPKPQPPMGNLMPPPNRKK